EGEPREVLHRHAAAVAAVVGPAARTPATHLLSAQPREELGVSPDLGEGPGAHVAGAELVDEDEGTGEHVAAGIDAADDAAGAAHVEPVERLTERGEVEEGVTGEHVGMGTEPAVQGAVLRLGQAQLLPHLQAAPRRTQPGEPQLRAVGAGEGVEAVEAVDAAAGCERYV